MKLYSTDEKGLLVIIEFVANSNPPDGITREEWKNEFKEVLIKHQIKKAMRIYEEDL